MKSSSLAFLLLLVGLIAGAGIGYLLGHGGTVEASDGQARVPDWIVPEAPDSDDRAESARTTELDDVAPLPERLASPAETTEGLTSVEAAQARRAAVAATSRVAATVLEDDSTWTGVITGTVVDEVGAPLAGVTVVSSGTQAWYNAEVTARSTEDVGRAFKGIKELEEEVGDYAEGRIKSRKKTRTALTDATGSFTLDGLEPGTHQVMGYLEGYVLKSTSIATGAGDKLVAKRVGSFELDLRLPDGTQPAEAIVMALDDDDREQVAGQWTPAAPEIRFASTKIRCRALAGEPRKMDWREVAAEFRSPLSALDLDRDGRGPHVVQLTAQTQLRVTVVDESTTFPRIDPWAKAKNLTASGAKDQALKRYRNGPFILTDLEPGQYEITAGRGKSEPEVTKTLQLVEGLNAIELILGEVDSTRFITVHCTAADGMPLSSVEFDYRLDTGNGSHSGGADAIDKTAGEYWIDRSEFGAGSETGKLVLTAKSAVYGRMSQEVDLNKATADFLFKAPAEVTVEVTGSRVGSLYATLVSVEEGAKKARPWERDARDAKVESDGIARIGLVQPGEYELQLAARENEWNFKPPIATRLVKVSAGPVTLSIDAPALSVVVIHAPEVEVGANVGLQIRDNEDDAYAHFGSAELDGEHRATFRDIAPGRYVVNIWSQSSQGQMEITVPCGEILFQADEVNGYEITQVTEGKLAEAAGLRKGDVILGVNEFRVEGVTFLNRMWVELGEGPSTLQVLRGGSEIQVELERLEGSANAWLAFGVRLTPRALGGQ